MSEQRPSHDERSESGWPHVADRAEGQTRRTIQETLIRARSMMSISRRGGTFRRLSSNERLRATSEPKEKKSKKTTLTVSGKNKPFYPFYVSKSTEYNFDVVKKLAGQGLLYIRIQNGFEFALKNPCSSDSDLPQVGVAPAVESKTEPEVIDIPDQIPLSAEHPGDNISVNYVPPTSPLHVEPTIEKIPDFFDKVVNELPSSITEPAETLRYLQKKIVKGRPLEINDTSVDLKGETNFITVDRDDILQTTFDELKNVADPSITFQVQFYGEQAADNEGPRKEWIQLCNQKIKLKYFEKGIKEHLSEDYFYVGQMASIALLQNGQLPVYIPEEILQQVFSNENEQLSPCIMSLNEEWIHWVL